MILKEEIIKNLMVMIVLDLNEPWTFVDEMNKWMDILTETLVKVGLSL